MKQIARNVTDSLDVFLCGKRYVVMDRDAKHCEAFRGILEQAGVHCLRLPPRSPNLSAHIERFMRSRKEESLDRMILFGETSLRNAVQEYLLHHHGERNHQGLDNRLIEPGEDVGRRSGEIACRERLGGMLRYYYREAA